MELVAYGSYAVEDQDLEGAAGVLMSFQLVLFSSDPEFVSDAEAAGIDGFIVDWECKGKESRQSGFDTEINRDTVEDLQRLRRSVRGTVWCRINAFHEATDQEVEAAVAGGADEIMLPMVRSVEAVEKVLDLVAGRSNLGILIETVQAVELAPELAKLPISNVYVGLNDLAICRESPSIFDAVADGTVEWLRAQFDIPFGFGGLTLPDCGAPIPCRLLMAEMARLNSNFSFLRRSFHRDIRGRQMSQEVPGLRRALSEAHLRSPELVEQEHQELQRMIANQGVAGRASG